MAPANSTAKHNLLLLAVAVAVALLLLAAPSSAGRGRRRVHLRLYMHDVFGGPGQTSVQVVTGRHPSTTPGSYFGDTVVIDDLLTDGPSQPPSSRAVGRARGTYVLASMEHPVVVVSVTLALTDGPYNGSTLIVAGLDDVSHEVRELAVVGGTGRLRRATGHVVWRTARVVTAADDVVLELDVHATVPTTAVDAESSRSNIPVAATAEF